MTVKYEYLVDGTKFAAVEYNTRFEPVFSWINSLTPESLSLGAFRQEHLPCLVGPAGVGEGKLTVGWDENGAPDFTSDPDRASRGYTALNNISHDAGSSAAIDIFRDHGFDWLTPAFSYTIILRCAWDADDPFSAAPIALSMRRGDLGRVGAIFLMGNFTVQRWMLGWDLGSTWITEPTNRDLNEDALALSAAFAIHYIPRNPDGTSAGSEQTVVLQKSQRSLSPRLTVGWDNYVTETIAGSSDIYPSSERDLFIATTFNTDSSPRVRIGDNTTSAGIYVDLERDLPDLWEKLNTGAGPLYLIISAPDNDGFHLDASGEAPVLLQTAPGFYYWGTPIDKDATVALHATGTLNEFVMDTDFVGTASTPHWPALSDLDADPVDFRWGVVAGKSAGGVPLVDDIHTDQDLALRTVLLPSDLPLTGGATYAEVTKVEIVAAQDGSMAGDGKFTVLVTNSNLSVLPLHVKVVT